MVDRPLRQLRARLAEQACGGSLRPMAPDYEVEQWFAAREAAQDDLEEFDRLHPEVLEELHARH